LITGIGVQLKVRDGLSVMLVNSYPLSSRVMPKSWKIRSQVCTCSLVRSRVFIKAAEGLYKEIP
jgi:hypothetical protein